MLDFLKNPEGMKDWRQFGGLDTLMSYGLSMPFNADAEQLAELAAALAKAMPNEHHGFLNHLLLSFGCGDFSLCTRASVPVLR